MFGQFRIFRKDEDGAVSVDWVVLTAAVIALAGVTVTAIEGSTGSVGDAVGTELTGTTVSK